MKSIKISFISIFIMISLIRYSNLKNNTIRNLEKKNVIYMQIYYQNYYRKVPFINIKPDQEKPKLYIEGKEYNYTCDGQCFVIYNTKTVTTFKLEWNSNLNEMICLFCGIFMRSVDFSEFDASEVTDMTNLFYECTVLRSVNFTGFKTFNVKSMESMFYECKILTSLDLNSFNTSNVETMNSMFYDCEKLITVSGINFDVKNVKNMNSMFLECYNLKNVTINFSYSKVENTVYMFGYCSSLEYLDLKEFTTPNLRRMKSMFEGCENLKFLNINKILTANVTDMSSIFSNCKSLKYLNLNSFRPLNSIGMNDMFYNCKSLTSISFNNLNEWKVKSMKYSFAKCISLKSVDLTILNTSQVKDMSYLFYGCNSLRYLNIGNFQTDNVLDMKYMFSECNSLLSLNLRNFRTSKVTNMESMFSYCNSLTSINLDNFDIKKVINLREMFMGCNSLLSLNLSNFILNQEVDISNMFIDCKKLKYINLYNFDIKENMKSQLMFLNNPVNLIYCIKEEYINSGHFDFFVTSSCSVNDCSGDWKKSIKKFIKEKNICVNKCSDDDTYKFEYEDICYKRCPVGTIRKSKNEFTCVIDEENENTELNENTEILIKTEIKEDIESIEDSISTKNSDITLLSSENIESIKNEDTSKITEFIENVESFENSESIENGELNKKYISENKEVEIIKKQLICNNYLPYLDLDNNQCVKNCRLSTFFNSKCIKNITNKNITQNHYSYFIDEITHKAEEKFLYNIIYGNNTEYAVKEDNNIYQLTTTYSQKVKYYSNISSIQLGECENYLKDFYKIDKNESLLILKIEYYIPNFKIPIIQFELFNPISKERLDYQICNNISIYYHIPVDINEDELYIYNKSDNYYKDRCRSVIKNESDITTYDRKKEFNDNYLSLCEKNCEFINYNKTSKKVVCQCSYEKKNIELDDIIDKDKLLNNFKDIRSSSNIDVILCIKILFSKGGLINNIGNYILILIILMFSISIPLFYLKEKIILLNKIQKIRRI